MLGIIYIKRKKFLKNVDFASINWNKGKDLDPGTGRSSLYQKLKLK